MATALDQLTGMPKLPVSSGLMGAMPKVPKGYVGPAEIAPAQEELRTEIGKAERKVGEADVAIEEAKRAEKGRQAEMKGKLLEEYKAGIEEMPERKALKEMRKREAGMEFIPTRDTVQDIAGLFGLIGVIGMVVGKGNAMQAMHAMNGMMEGHRKGRADLFKQQQIEFDKNFKAMQAKVSAAKDEYIEALETKKIDREAGELKIQNALAKMESPLLRAMKDKQGDVAVLNALKDVEKDMETGVRLRNDLQAKVDEREFRREQAQQQAELRKELARISAEKRGTAGELPKDKETNNEHRFRHSAMVTVQEVLEDLRDPQIRKLIGPQNQYMPDVILNLQDKYPQLAQKLARFQSEEFKIGGKALTASEQKILGPIYNWRGLTAKALEDNLKEAERTMDKEQRYLENRYPGLKQFTYEEPKVTPTPVGDRADAEALAWANANPNDPRSAKIKERLGVQ